MRDESEATGQAPLQDERERPTTTALLMDAVERTRMKHCDTTRGKRHDG